MSFTRMEDDNEAVHQPVVADFFPSFTMLGHQPSLLFGCNTGALVKWNTHHGQHNGYLMYSGARGEAYDTAVAINEKYRARSQAAREVRAIRTLVGVVAVCSLRACRQRHLCFLLWPLLSLLFGCACRVCVHVRTGGLTVVCVCVVCVYRIVVRRPGVCQACQPAHEHRRECGCDVTQRVRCVGKWRAALCESADSPPPFWIALPASPTCCEQL